MFSSKRYFRNPFSISKSTHIHAYTRGCYLLCACAGTRVLSSARPPGPGLPRQPPCTLAASETSPRSCSHNPASHHPSQAWTALSLAWPGPLPPPTGLGQVAQAAPTAPAHRLFTSAAQTVPSPAIAHGLIAASP